MFGRGPLNLRVCQSFEAQLVNQFIQEPRDAVLNLRCGAEVPPPFFVATFALHRWMISSLLMVTNSSSMTPPSARIVGQLRTTRLFKTAQPCFRA